MPVDAEMPEDKWETVVDFTDRGRAKGVPLKEVLKEMRKCRDYRIIYHDDGEGITLKAISRRDENTYRDF